jgi:hypothetical protein
VIQDITDKETGLSRLLSERCSTCVMRAGDLMYLGPARLSAFIREALENESYIVCHQTLTYGDHPDFGPAICRGFFDAFGNRSVALIMLQVFDMLQEVNPPEN